MNTISYIWLIYTELSHYLVLLAPIIGTLMVLILKRYMDYKFQIAENKQSQFFERQRDQINAGIEKQKLILSTLHESVIMWLKRFIRKLHMLN